MFKVNKPFIALATSTLVVLSAISAPAISSTDDPSKDVDKLMIVDCMLPGKIMRLGGGARYMSARRPTKTTGADCEIRGGEYVAYDRANYATSLKVWLPDAKAGDPKAQTYVGEMFEQGLGTSPDFATAVAWYRKAAEQGYDRAQMNLGSMYERGLGVEKDELEALNWYRKATGMGDDELVLSSEVEELEAETEELRTALAASEAEVARLKDSLSTSQREVNNSQARLDSSLLQLEEMRYRSSRAQASGMQGADVAALNEEIKRKETELAANRRELMDLRINFDRQQAEFAAQLSARPNDSNSYQAVMDLESQKIRSLEDQVQQLTGSLQLRQSELSNSNAQLAALRRQLQAQAANDQAASNDSIAELSAIISAQQTELDQKSSHINSLQTEFEQQEQQLVIAQSILKEREESLRQSTASQSEEQQAALAQERSRIASQQGEVDRLSRELEMNQSNVSQGNDQLTILNRQLEIANSRRASSEESLAELSQVIATQQADLEQKSLSISFLQQELQNQEQRLSLERSAFEQREKGLRESSDLAVMEQQSVQTRLSQTGAQLSDYQQRLIESDRVIQAQQADIMEQQNEITRMQENQQRREYAQGRALEAKLGDQNIGLARAQGENAALRTEIDAMEAELTRLRNQVALIDNSETLVLRGPLTPAPVSRPRPNIPSVDFGNYHALIIGNNSYTEFPSLETPVNDARAMDRILKDKYGFKTQVLINADRYTILQTLNSYRERLTEDDNFLLFYAGHGTLDEKNDRGHWLPVDASPGNPANWISNVTITDYINTMTAKHIMVIADSCYSGTLARQVRTIPPGGKSRKIQIEHYKLLAKIVSRSALTSGGTQPVMDGGGGDHSIFANSLLSTLESNNEILQGPDLFLEVHQKVSSSGSNAIQQIPAFNAIKNTGDMGAPFFFVPS